MSSGRRTPSDYAVRGPGDIYFIFHLARRRPTGGDATATEIGELRARLELLDLRLYTPHGEDFFLVALIHACLEAAARASSDEEAEDAVAAVRLVFFEVAGFEDLNFVLYGYGDGSFGAMLEAYAKTSSFISVAESGLGSPADLRAEKKRAAHKRRCAADPDGEAARRRVKQATSRERAAALKKHEAKRLEHLVKMDDRERADAAEADRLAAAAADDALAAAKAAKAEAKAAKAKAKKPAAKRKAAAIDAADAAVVEARELGRERKEADERAKTFFLDVRSRREAADAAVADLVAALAAAKAEAAELAEDEADAEEATVRTAFDRALAETAIPAAVAAASAVRAGPAPKKPKAAPKPKAAAAAKKKEDIAATKIALENATELWENGRGQDGSMARAEAVEDLKEKLRALRRLKVGA